MDETELNQRVAALVSEHGILIGQVNEIRMTLQLLRERIVSIRLGNVKRPKNFEAELKYKIDRIHRDLNKYDTRMIAIHKELENLADVST